MRCNNNFYRIILNFQDRRFLETTIQNIYNINLKQESFKINSTFINSTRFIKQNEKRWILSNLYLTIINPYFPNEKKKTFLISRKEKPQLKEIETIHPQKLLIFNRTGKRERQTDTERERRSRRKRGENCNKGMTLITVKYVSQ